ncbi:hypothetical protein AAMO2058_000569100 [Amorphochlora amoebiformis]|uniref:t-SNARE coiled-coil homology domain-containing protein n=1 Tax=Amorphochlora amoebiformis TaxID=1561963 RepID=A0A7S0DFA0_9EUKA
MDPLHAGREDSEAEDDEYGGADPIDELISTFQGVVVQCRRKMNVLSHVTTGELKHNVEQVTELHSTARDLLEKIQDEAQANSSRYMRTVRMCIKDFERLDDRFELVMSREELSRYVTGVDVDDDRREVLVSDRLMRENTHSIEEVRKRLNETTEEGGMIMNDLKGQSDTLKRTIGTMLETGEVIKESKKVLDGMARSAATNKLTTALIVLLEIFIIGIIVYFKYLMPSR